MTKRLVDIALASFGLLMLWPMFLVVAVLIKIDSPGPVFYKSVRAGKYGKPFAMWKFRTMVSNAERLGGSDTANDDPRLTRIGKRLRRYNLDEFPQLINVLKGEMSIVGPRPEVVWKIERYTPEEKRALDVLPGMTDYASLRFLDEGKILEGSSDPEQTYNENIRPEKIRLELHYVENHSFWSDVAIMMKTLWMTFFR